jgi:hypothetical protein
MTRSFETEITIPVKITYDYDEGERMTKWNPGSQPSVEIDLVHVVGDPSNEDILRVIPQATINELKDECWENLKL